uniref:Uncharacterized protein n=1 Tax=Panagrolaimus sp. JU765 TaxID=591449 RepID=A0AC34RGF3_9BILA
MSTKTETVVCDNIRLCLMKNALDPNRQSHEQFLIIRKEPRFYKGSPHTPLNLVVEDKEGRTAELTFWEEQSLEIHEQIKDVQV